MHFQIRLNYTCFPVTIFRVVIEVVAAFIAKTLLNLPKLDTEAIYLTLLAWYTVRLPDSIYHRLHHNLVALVPTYTQIKYGK